jgi:hypothetical protein
LTDPAAAGSHRVVIGLFCLVQNGSQCSENAPGCIEIVGVDASTVEQLGTIPVRATHQGFQGELAGGRDLDQRRTSVIRVADQLDLPGSSQVIDDTLNALSGQTQPSRGTGGGARSVRENAQDMPPCGSLAGLVCQGLACPARCAGELVDVSDQ